MKREHKRPAEKTSKVWQRPVLRSLDLKETSAAIGPTEGSDIGIYS